MVKDAERTPELLRESGRRDNSATVADGEDTE